MKNERRALDRVQGENLLEKTLFLDFFAQALTVPVPPKERKGGWAGDGLGALSIKKEPRNEFLSPFCGVLFE